MAVVDQLELVYNADVEPDADGDGFGDETQDLCAADPTRQTACVADLAVRGTATPASVRFGRTLHYTFTVTNLGAGPAESVVLTAIASARTPYRGSTCTTPPGAGVPGPQIGFLGCRFRTNRLTGSLGTLRPGRSATVRLNIAAAADRSMAMRVRVTSRATDAQAANDAAAFTNAVRVRRGRCVNTLVGTASADVLRGTVSGDRLSGRGGRDRIVGRAGADCLTGGRGRDTISGGPGNDEIASNLDDDIVSGDEGDDRIQVVSGGIDRIDCGDGFDVVFADAEDVVAANCEDIRR
jgi:uncharacterized repeat protein (TIGR01451 family)